MVESEFKHYTVPVPAEVNYSNWQTVKQRTFAAAQNVDGSLDF